MRNFKIIGFTFLMLIACVSSTYAAAPPPGLVHIRGAITAISANSVTVQTASGTQTVQLPPKIGVNGLIPSSRTAVKPGSFLGIASVPNASGVQSAREVVVFPEAARGTGEGSYDWDLPTHGGHSRMTNGTVAIPSGHSKMTNGTVTTASVGQVELTYSSGDLSGRQQIVLPPGIPFVTFVPGSLTLLKPGAHVFILAKPLPAGKFIAVRVLVGINGLVPPM